MEGRRVRALLVSALLSGVGTHALLAAPAARAARPATAAERRAFHRAIFARLRPCRTFGPRLCRFIATHDELVTDDGRWATAVIFGNGPASSTVQAEQITLRRTAGRWRFWGGEHFRCAPKPVVLELHIGCT